MGPTLPDLTPLHFFLWAHVKSNIYKTPVKNLTEFKRGIKSISKETLSDVFSNIVKTMDLCISLDGHHQEHLLSTKLS